ncbi:hypothetical protein WA026_002153 [Henosepilachna vigintioctopunctata]|uniref:Uncharacterized protein n=1 Tax=Henosepilachna vigintioctopunctata TaxID=420089 RepID=A0AAW1TYY5_9CUCU
MLLIETCLLVLVFVNTFTNSGGTKCDFFQNITIRLTPKTRFPYPKTYEVNNFSGCFEQTAFEETIKRLIVYDQNVEYIGDHAVHNMPELNTLGFNGCKINSISTRAFRDLPKLKELYIRFGNLTKIWSTVFNEITSLEIIDLYGNEISKIEVYAFGYMENLKQVIVSKNKLDKLYGIWFQNSSNIELLNFSENRIANISRFVFSKMSKLKDIFLDFNEISYIEDTAFENLKNLTYLGLSHNRLMVLDAKIFPETLYIEFLMINANYLNYLSNELLKKLSVKEMTLEGNPWKCPCLDRIHKWILKSNSTIRSTNFCIGDNIPRCFYSDEDQFCSETNDVDMTKSYLKTLKGLKKPLSNFCARLDDFL